MAVKRGQLSQLGLVDEVTYGTPVVVTRFYEFNSEDIRLDIEPIYSEGIRAGRQNIHRIGAYARHRKGAGGTVELEFMQKGFGILLKHMLGAVVTTGTNPYTHTGSVASLIGDFFTLQVGRDDQAFTYEGCKVNEWELSCAVGEFLKLSLTIDAEDENTGVALATASYPTNIVPFSFLNGALTVGGTATHVTEFTFSGNNNLATERYFIRASGLKKEPTDQGREYTGELTLEFEDLTAYNLFINGTESQLILTFTAGADTFTVTAPTCLFTGETPTVEGPEIIPLTLPFTVLGDTLTAVLVNTEATA